MQTLSRIASLLSGLALIVAGGYMANKWGDGAVSTAAGLALITIGTGLCSFTTLIMPQPKFMKEPKSGPE